MAGKTYDNDASFVGKVSQSGTPSVGADLITKTHLDTQLANKQAVVAGLTDLIARWIAASTAGPASLDFAEDTDQGSNRIRVIGQGTLSGDFTVTIPGVSGTLYLTGGTDVDVTDGGTGRSTSTTAYGILAAGTTATGPHQTISPGTTGHFLKSAGASALAAMAAIAQSDVTGLVTDLGNKQPLDTDLTTLASLSAATDSFIVAVANAWAARTPAQVKTTLAINNLDNTSDANKPVSSAQATAIALKADHARTISTTAPLTGGGDLSANRTLAISAASASAVGAVELLTPAEVSTGTDTTRAMTAEGAASTYVKEITFTVPGTLVVGAGAARYYLPTARTISAVRASVGTAPTGASVIVDVNKNGTTIYGTQGNRPTIAISGFTDLGEAASGGVCAAGDYLTIDVDQVGSTIAGANLTVTIVF